MADTNLAHQSIHACLSAVHAGPAPSRHRVSGGRTGRPRRVPPLRCRADCDNACPDRVTRTRPDGRAVRPYGGLGPGSGLLPVRRARRRTATRVMRTTGSRADRTPRGGRSHPRPAGGRHHRDRWGARHVTAAHSGRPAVPPAASRSTGSCGRADAAARLHRGGAASTARSLLPTPRRDPGSQPGSVGRRPGRVLWRVVDSAGDRRSRVAGAPAAVLDQRGRRTDVPSRPRLPTGKDRDRVRRGGAPHHPRGSLA